MRRPHGLLEDDERRRGAVADLFGVEETERDQAPGEPQVRLAEALGPVDNRGVEPLSVRDLPAPPGAVGRAKDLVPAG